MADALAYLDGIAARVSSTLLPAELTHMTRFLLGLDEARVSGSLPVRSAEHATNGPPTPQLVTVRIPNGLVGWHGFIPLAISAGSLATVAAADDRAALRELFLREGFREVLAVNLNRNANPALTPTMGGGGSGGGSADDLGVDGGDGQRSETGGLARARCVDAIARVCASVAAAGARRRAPAPSRKRSREDEPPAGRAPHTVQRLLVVVSCCADNRRAASTMGRPSSSSTTAATAAGWGGGSVGSRSGPKVSGGGEALSASGGAHRHRHGPDPLSLLLHDITAVMALSDARLAWTSSRVRVSVLVLPDDHVYGGTLLARRLREELGHRFDVRLFDHEESGSQGCDTGAAAAETPGAASRARRLLSVWEPAVLERGPPSTSEGEQVESVWRPWTEVEALVLRHRRLFFLRHRHLPLCRFLREALRLFPVLVPAEVLRQWQVVWTARHSLRDVVMSFHTALASFPSACAFVRAAEACWGESATDTAASHTISPSSSSAAPLNAFEGSVEEELEARGRCRTGAAAVLADSTRLIESLLEAAAALNPGSDAAGADVLFALLYGELITESGSRHLLHIPVIVAALAHIYDEEYRHVVDARRHRGARAHVGGGMSSMVDGPAVDVSLLPPRERARRVLRKHLPYGHISRLVVPHVRHPSSTHRPTPDAAGNRSDGATPTGLPTVMRLDGVRTKAGPALYRTVLSAVAPPSTSLRELRAAVAAFIGSLHRARRGLAEDERAGQPLCEPPTWVPSPKNFYSPATPDAVRALYVLTAHAARCRTERQKYVPVVQVQQVCQLSDEQLLLVLRELQLAGLAVVNVRDQTARTALGEY